MIETGHGDILRADAEALVNTVNCEGVMGRGIALQFKKAYPANFEAYRRACERGEVRPGAMFMHETDQLTNPRFIINFPTKRHWRSKSRLADIEAGLEALVYEIAARKIRSIAMPPLGCGLGGLDWRDVRPRIERALAVLPEVRAIVFPPAGAPATTEMVRENTIPNMTVGRAALLGLMQRYLAGLMDPFVTLLELHKLMYFQQVAGESLRLRFEKGLYGPYARNLGNVLSRIEGHLVTGYADGGDAPDKQIEAKPEAVETAKAFLHAHPETERRFERVADLVEGFESPFGLELLATVHWIAATEGARSADEAVAQTHAWNPRKRMFRPEQIKTAWGVLRDKGWLSQSVA